MQLAKGSVMRVLTGLALVGGLACQGRAQQVLQRGALGAPASVLDEARQWTAAIPVAASPQEDVFISDVSTTPWLARNYDDFAGRGVYSVTTFTQYKRPSACRRDLIRWGNGDTAHLNACVDIGYRLRQLRVDLTQKTVTLLFSSMLDQEGNLLQDQTPAQTGTRLWTEMDPFAQEMIGRMNKLVAENMRLYSRKMNSLH